MLKQIFFRLCVLSTALLCGSLTLALSNKSDLDLENTVEQSLRLQQPTSIITGIKCHSANGFFEAEGIDDSIRETALLAVKNKLFATNDSSLCNPDRDFSLNRILQLKTIPVNEIILGADKLIAARPELSSSLLCLKQKKTAQLYVNQLKIALESLWTDDLSPDFKKSVIFEAHNQNPEMPFSEEKQKGWLDTPASDWLTLSKFIKKTHFCFADLKKKTDERATTYLVHLNKGPLQLSLLQPLRLNLGKNNNKEKSE
ncbi:MAG: hypothetical protein ACXWRG_09640 [Bdellovibrio sp.]